MCARERDTAQVVYVGVSLSKGAAEPSLAAVARVAKAAHRLEECLQRRTSEAGWADDDGRHGTGGPHPQTLSCIATWFFVTATRRGTTMDPGENGAPEPRW